MAEAEMAKPKVKEIVTALSPIINVAMPLVQTPPLKPLRDTLLFEFPYAKETSSRN
jgi:hypothetical protein